MKSLRQLWDSYATPVTADEQALLDRMDGAAAVALEAQRGGCQSLEPTDGGPVETGSVAVPRSGQCSTSVSGEGSAK